MPPDEPLPVYKMTPPDSVAIVIAPPACLLVFFFVSRFVRNRLPLERLPGWHWVTVGGYIAITGLAIAFYSMEIQIGTKIMFAGVIFVWIGLGRFFLKK